MRPSMVERGAESGGSAAHGVSVNSNAMLGLWRAGGRYLPILRAWYLQGARPDHGVPDHDLPGREGTEGPGRERRAVLRHLPAPTGADLGGLPEVIRGRTAQHGGCPACDGR